MKALSLGLVTILQLFAWVYYVTEVTQAPNEVFTMMYVLVSTILVWAVFGDA